jgi:putative addiction module killer protein
VQVTPRDVRYCQTRDGREPFSEWLDDQDAKTQAIVLKRLDKVGEGLFGDVWPVGGGVSELRFDYGPGYRVYFGQIGMEVYVISGGTKKHQQRDIDAAKEFWRRYA